jgi:hypothetical protein
MSDDTERFTITMRASDAEQLDKMARRVHMSRNRYVILAILEKMKTEPAGCPICGKMEDHSH